MKAMLERLCLLFETVARLRHAWLPEDVRADEIRRLCVFGNHRQQFHVLRDLLPPLRSLLARLDATHTTSDSFLQQLHNIGVLSAPHAIDLVANAHEGLTEEILSPPTHLRRLWKPVAQERRAPEDRNSDSTEQGTYTQYLWSSGLRVKDARNPPMSEFEIQSVFGPHATMTTHGNHRLPYVSGTHKYRLVENDPIVAECTSRGLSMTSGPSGTAYRFLNLWLALRGPEEELPAVCFAVASLLLSGCHHSLLEVMITFAPIMKRKSPGSLLDMIEHLVPADVNITTSGETFRITPDEFHRQLSLRLDSLLGRTSREVLTTVDSQSPPSPEASSTANSGDTGSGESWPSSAPPSAINIALAINLCRTIDRSTDRGRDPVVCSISQTGWSAQDCIKIRVAVQRYMVKVPKQHTSESIRTCLAKAARASWAAERGIGPRLAAMEEQSGAFATEFITGHTLPATDATDCITDVLELLRKLHNQPATTWMKHYSPIDAVQSYVDEAKLQASMTPEDVRLIETVLSHSRGVLASTPTSLVPCHNDFHSHNIMLDEKGRLWAIDFENCDLGDPMWDLAYLILNLGLEPLDLAEQYGCTVEEQSRLPAHYLIAIAHCAT